MTTEAKEIQAFELELWSAERSTPVRAVVEWVVLVSSVVGVCVLPMLITGFPFHIFFLTLAVVGMLIATISNVLKPTRAANTEKTMLRLGVDGLEYGGLRIRWSEFERCDRDGGTLGLLRKMQDPINMRVRLATALEAPGVGESIGAERLAESINAAHQRYLARPAAPPLPPELKQDQAALQEDYRGSNRGLLVRVATHPGADPEDRKVAVRALAPDPNARAQIEAELDHTLDEETVETLRAALDLDRR